MTEEDSGCDSRPVSEGARQQPDGGGAGPRALATVCSVLLVILVAHNFYWLGRNQVKLDRQYEPHRSPRDLPLVASRSPFPRIANFVAIQHLLREAIGGKELTLPPGWEDKVWGFAHVAGVRVVVSKEPLSIDEAAARRLRDHGLLHRVWAKRFGPGGTLLKTQDLYMDLREAEAYVMAQGPGSQLFLVPKADYQALTASAGESR